MPMPLESCLYFGNIEGKKEEGKGGFGLISLRLASDCLAGSFELAMFLVVRIFLIKSVFLAASEYGKNFNTGVVSYAF